MDKKQISGYPTPPKDYYKVYVRSCTYNQSQYIVDCLNGVAMQKTDFPFVHHVIDDFSTDGEQEVIKAWIERECNLETAEYYDNDICTITFAKHKSNQNYTIAAYFLKRNIFRDYEKRNQLYKIWRDVCPYEALCEGDDYWINPQKLQRQYIFMEESPAFSMCCHRVICKAEKDCKNKDIFGWIQTQEFTIKDFLAKWIAPTCSIFMRTEVTLNIPSNKKFTIGDSVIVATCFRYGRVYCYGEDWGIYRINSGSWNGTKTIEEIAKLQISHIKGMQEEFLFYNDPIIDNILKSYYFRLLTIYKKRKDIHLFNDTKKEYMSYLKKSNIIDFYVIYAYKALKTTIKNIICK